MYDTRKTAIVTGASQGIGAGSSPRSDDYAWEIATLFPEQGGWSEEEYLRLTDETNRLIEFDDGRVEFLPTPTELHQALVGFLYHALLSFVTLGDLGVVPFPPLPFACDLAKFASQMSYSSASRISIFAAIGCGTERIW